MGVKAPSLDALANKFAITEVLYKYCRAMDRMDEELGKSCFHSDARDQHSALFSGSGWDWIDWVNRFHAPMEVTRHNLSNILIEIDGNDAWVESYWSLLLRFPLGGDMVDFIASGRYLDHMKCINGEWAISHRRTTNDWDRLEKVTGTVMNYNGKPAMEIDSTVPIFYPKRDRTDESYRFLSGHETAFGNENPN